MGRVDQMALVGGHPAVDFVNTLGGLPGADDDEYLTCEQDLDVWCHRVGLISREPTGTSTVDAGTLSDVLVLRAALDQILRAQLKGRPGSHTATARVREYYTEAVEHGSLRWDRTGYHLEWTIQPRSRHPLWQLAATTIDLLTGNQLDRLAHCGRCRWLFIDHSRSHTRRWCTMTSCGAITKMRRYRRKAN